MSNLTVDKDEPRANTYKSRDAFDWLRSGCTFILCASLLSPFGALPIFDTGYFNLVATSILWLHICAGAGGALIAVGILVRPREVLPFALNPVSLGLAAFALLTMVPAIYAEFPALVLFGGPQSGKGALWFMDAAIFVALGFMIRNVFRASLIVFCMSAGVVAVISGILADVRLNHSEVLLRGGDSYAYLGLALPFLILFVPKTALRLPISIAALTVSAFCLAVADNKTAVIVGIVFFCSFLALRKLPMALDFFSRLRFLHVLLALLLTSAALTYALIAIEFRGVFDSIDSRLLIADIAASAQRESSAIEWIFGHGWGHTQSGLYRNLTESNVDLLGNKWDFLWRDIFHSHNLTLELIFETGLAGYFAFSALLAAFAISSPFRLAALTFAAGYMVMSSVWFEFAHTVPILSLAVLALAPDVNSFKTTAQHPVVGFFGYSVVMALCLATSVMLFDFARQVKFFKPSRGALERTNYPIDRFPDDPRGNDFIRASVYRDVLRQIKQTSAGHTKSTAVVQALLNDIEARIPTTSSPELLLIGLVIFNDANYIPERAWMRPLVKKRQALWDRLVTKHMQLAPKRTDVLVVYLSWLTTNHKTARARKITKQILQSNPREPVGLYFEGVIDTQTPSPIIKRRGLILIARAVENGVERYVEVPNWLKSLAAKTKAP